MRLLKIIIMKNTTITTLLLLLAIVATAQVGINNSGEVFVTTTPKLYTPHNIAKYSESALIEFVGGEEQRTVAQAATEPRLTNTVRTFTRSQLLSKLGRAGITIENDRSVETIIEELNNFDIPLNFLLD